MDKHVARQQIVDASLPHIAFDGWTMRALMRGAEDAGYPKQDVIRIFPEGAIGALECWFASADAALEGVLASYHVEGMKIRERIALAVRLRMEYQASHQEALRRAVYTLMLPLYLHRAARILYRTVDSIWYAVGDQSTDFNFYTKRASLAAVYTSTLRYRLQDCSPGAEGSWAFLDRRIEDVMQIQKWKQKLRRG